MKGALIILAVMVAIGVVLYLDDLRRRRRQKDTDMAAAEEESLAEEDNGEEKEPGSVAADNRHGGTSTATYGDPANAERECCGLHAVCEKKYRAPADKIVYYDDEELDALADRDPSTYSDEEMEQLRDVVLTLLPSDAHGWARSLEMRHIELPQEIRDELLLLMEEA